ncbi:MAG: nucleotidyltransferase family protein [Clostridia bacterium]|nr:nucleotidyltransferase family protein [Clostridia bacterium]
MRTAGIICEYNPFHYGHKHQLDTLRSEYDAIVCVMSGSFVQRGDIAVFDKWTRAKAALSFGADLVIELPVKYSLSSACGFAEGGIQILDALGLIDAVSFGSECGDIAVLENCAETMLCEPYEVSAKIKEFTACGMSYAKAHAAAYDGILDSDIISKPNNILAIEYIKALKKIGSRITPVTLARKGVGYHDLTASGKFASATLLREKLKNNEDISEFTPFDFSACERYDINRLTDIFKYKLISEGTSAFCNIPDMERGLDNRFLKAVDKSSITEMLDFVKTKRYTYTRLSRIVLSVLLELRGNLSSPEYIRVLGMTDTGRKLLSEMKNTCPLPVVNKVADFDSDAILPDILATNLAALCADKPVFQNRDYTTSPVIL